jgi:hypothetical protein
MFKVGDKVVFVNNKTTRTILDDRSVNTGIRNYLIDNHTEMHTVYAVSSTSVKLERFRGRTSAYIPINCLRYAEEDELSIIRSESKSF